MFKRPARRAGNGRVTTYRILLTVIIINVNVQHVDEFVRILSSIDSYEWYYDRRLSPIQTLIRTGAFRGGTLTSVIFPYVTYITLYFFLKKHKSLQTASNTKSMPKQISEK